MSAPKKLEKCPRCPARIRQGEIDLIDEQIAFDLPGGGVKTDYVCRACADELTAMTKAPDPTPEPAKVVGYSRYEFSTTFGRKKPKFRKYEYHFELKGETQRKGKCVATDPAEGIFNHRWAIVRYRNFGNYRYCRHCFPRTGKLFRVNVSDGRWPNLLKFTKDQRRQLGAQV